MTLFINKIQSAPLLVAAAAFVAVKLHLKWCHVSLVTSLGNCKVGLGIDSTMIGMCLDGYTLEEVELTELRISYSTHKFFFHKPVQPLTECSHSFFHMRLTAVDREVAITVLLQVLMKIFKLEFQKERMRLKDV